MRKATITLLKAKDFGKEWQLFIPGANFIFCILRCCCTADTIIDENHPTDDNSHNSINLNEKRPITDEINENNTIDDLSNILNKITPETPQEEMISSSKQISALLTEFFNLSAFDE